MAFPPQFLDDIRARIGLTDVIGRRVRLVKKGREHAGLCPFHNEKTPSFTVSEEKGFFHCFGCGAHGDVIGYVMRADGLSFPEAVERLAADAGLEVPRQTPEEREHAKRQADLYEVMENGCAFFEERLRAHVGEPALAYLRGRGLDDETIARFRLGYAPDTKGALRGALMSETLPEAMLVEAGLLIRPDDGVAYDRFRGRVTFPITDRRGRVIAFGARILDDGKPKYLNSPDTPLFNKGRVLYGMAAARRAAHDAGRVIVTEGYMDVIALAKAGFTESVAPLGTALTESQMHELWRLAPEPLLCFDGDDAGQRAAWRAAERALPLLEPGRSLRFVMLPRGEDPDSLIVARGTAAFAALIDAARPLADVIWDVEAARLRLDTPERVAGLEKRLDDHVYAIAERKVQFQYRAHFRKRLGELTGRFRVRPHGYGPGAGLGARIGTGPLRRRQDQILLAAALNHPGLLDEFAERLASINLSQPKLDKLREEILLVYADRSGLDSEGLERQLREQGFAEELDELLGPDVYVHAAFARPDASFEDAEIGFKQTLLRHLAPSRSAQVDQAKRTFASEPTTENWIRLQTLQNVSQHDIDRHEALMADKEDFPPGEAAASSRS